MRRGDIVTFAIFTTTNTASERRIESALERLFGKRAHGGHLVNARRGHGATEAKQKTRKKKKKKETRTKSGKGKVAVRGFLPQPPAGF